MSIAVQEDMMITTLVQTMNNIVEMYMSLFSNSSANIFHFHVINIHRPLAYHNQNKYYYLYYKKMVSVIFNVLSSKITISMYILYI